MADSEPPHNDQPRLFCEKNAADSLRISLGEDWLRDLPTPDTVEFEEILQRSSGIRQLEFDCQELKAWDSSLLTCLLRLIRRGEEGDIEVLRQGLPEGVQKLLNLATAVPEKATARRYQASEPFLSVVGNQVLDGLQAGGQMLAFLGETALVFGRLLRGKARFRGSDLSLLLQIQNGSKPMPYDYKIKEGSPNAPGRSW